jgi:glutathione synthase/RimK-type ligase-like ATP-grasp enzyme
VTPAEWEAAAKQTMALLHGMQHVPGPTWVSPPAAIRAAEDKALQLAVAADVGFDVPATTWTNDIAVAERQLAAHTGVGIVKATTTAYWEDDQTSHFVFAHPVSVADLPAAGRLATTPMAFQQRIEPKRDVRVTVVGSGAFAAVTDDASPHAPDWRLADDTTWTAYDLPDDVRERCVTLVRRLGLEFGGIDLLVDADGRHWFCEVNPNGEWGWLQVAGLPIADALAVELVR